MKWFVRLYWVTLLIYHHLNNVCVMSMMSAFKTVSTISQGGPQNIFVQLKQSRLHWNTLFSWTLTVRHIAPLSGITHKRNMWRQDTVCCYWTNSTVLIDILLLIGSVVFVSDFVSPSFSLTKISHRWQWTDISCSIWKLRA